MRYLKLLSFLVAAQLFMTGAAFAQARGTAAEAKALTEKALAYIKEVGPDKAFAEFSDKDNAKWHEKDLYIYGNNFEGVAVTNGANKALVGKALMDAKDPNGKAFVKEMVDTAKNKGSGWVDYMYTDPITKKLVPKSGYVVRIPGYEGYVGAGIYK